MEEGRERARHGGGGKSGAIGGERARHGGGGESSTTGGEGGERTWHGDGGESGATGSMTGGEGDDGAVEDEVVAVETAMCGAGWRPLCSSPTPASFSRVGSPLPPTLSSGGSHIGRIWLLMKSSLPPPRHRRRGRGRRGRGWIVR
uniref:Uncharacterized protein n=1 Tax=Oryza sativa subsp. japonica TaxID=39947 RepID=Q6YY76_ORYSJ|nr:hypothetical protein [Oryza sativa Japonica Group]